MLYPREDKENKQLLYAVSYSQVDIMSLILKAAHHIHICVII